MSNNTPNNISFNIFSSQFLTDQPQLVKFLSWWKTNALHIYLGIIIIASFFTFFAIGRQDANKTNCLPKIGNTCYLTTYSSHSDLYWDENFHVASAQRYLHGYFFMEPHPPLGKLIIALGEKIINPNSNLSTEQLAFGSNDGDSLPFIPNSSNDSNIHSFVSFKDGYIPKAGETPIFNFSGVRFFPVVMAWLVAPLIFILLYLLMNNKHIAFLFSLGYVFDNTLIVHSRGAMVDGIQLFFIISAFCYFVYLMKQNKFKNLNFAYLGLLVGLAVATKINGLIIAPLGLFLITKQIWGLPYLQKKYIIRTLTVLAVAAMVSLMIAFVINKFGPIQIDTDGKNNPAEIASIEKKNFDGLKNFYILDIFAGLIISIFSFKIANKYSLGYWWKDEYTTINPNKEQKKLEETNEQMDYTDWQNIKIAISKWITQLGIFFFMIGAVFCGSYYAHFTIANKVLMPKDYMEVFAKKEIAQNGIQTSTDPKSCPERNQNGCKNGNIYPNYIEQNYRDILTKGEQSNISNFWTQLKSHLWYTHVFEKGVPSFDPTKGNNEAGSLPFTWPLGNHPIRYTVTPNVVVSPDNNPENTITYLSYLYLIPNIFIWLMVFIGVILSLVLILGRIVFGLRITNGNQSKFLWICLFTGMYISYMIVMTSISRVMYLYHYFLPLIFGLITTALLFDYYFINRNKKIAILIGLLIGLGIITVFVIFAPFSYRFDLTEADFNFRNWSKYWALVR